MFEIGDKNIDLSEQLYKEIKLNNFLGLIDYIKSSFSNSYYITKNIDIIRDNVIKKLEYIFLLLNDYFSLYLEKLLYLFNKAYELLTIKFTDEQSIIWKEIENYYHSIKDKIENIQNVLCDNI